jgi:hypothetical protein
VSSKICAAINKCSCNNVTAIRSVLKLAKHRTIFVHLSKSSLITVGVSKTHLLHPKLRNIKKKKTKMPYCLNTH